MPHLLDHLREALHRANPLAAAEISDGELQAMIGECRGRLDHATIRTVTDCVVAHAIEVAVQRGNRARGVRARAGEVRVRKD